MKVPLVFFALIASSAFVIEAHEGRVRVIPHTLKKDPWLIPKEGVLVTEHTPVYLAAKDDDGEVQFSEVPGVMKKVAARLLNDEKYQRASVGNISNSHDYPILDSMLPSSVPGQWPDILYPELLVVVAHDLYEKLGNNLMEAIPYLLAFWNGVDMMYRSIENPKIRYNIAGIIVETESGVFDYLAPHSYTKSHISGYGMYTAKKFWYFRKDQIPLNSYDAVVTMTTSSLCADSYECNSPAAGKSWVGSMCLDDSARYETQKVIIFTDNGKFSGIPVVAHELGHALGMHHDDDKRFESEEELKDLPGCRNVNWGHVMGAAVDPASYERRWSQCSLEQLEKFIETKNPACLYNPPAVGNIHIPRLLPGKLASVDDYCQAHGYDAVCDSYMRVCEQIKCRNFDNSNHCMHSSSLVGAEGTPCDKYEPDAFCLFGKCVSESSFT